ncbi:MAG TPA: hypothetical protein VKB52_16255 [Rhodanobacteraceae bacterium]|nr:hypothetical protein [Rhodanobacteraceae bacterium]
MQNESAHAARPAVIVPFWERLPEIARYPAHPAALTTIAVLAVCHLVSGLPLGFVLDLFVWVALYKYAFECLRATADGRMEPPEIAVHVEDSLGWLQIVLQIVFLGLNMLAYVVLGPVGGAIVSIVLALGLPGAIMSLAMDENLVIALNPATWLAIFMRIGWPYLAVAGFYFVFGVSERFAQGLAVPILPGFVTEIVFYFIAQYVIVATFHLMGYLIYQYHEEVGYAPVPQQALSRGPDPDQSLLDEADRLEDDGKPDAAAEILAITIRGRGGSEAMHTQYRRLLALLERREALVAHGRDWITILVGQNKDKRAVEVARECLEIDPAFELGSPDDVARVAQKAVDTGATQVALKLVSTYLKSNPRHRDVPRNALIAAKVLGERMGKDDVARRLLDQTLERFPNDPLAGDIAAYRAFLGKVATPPARA